MWQQFIQQLPQGFDILREGVGVYFGSVLLVLLALIPTAGRIAGVISGWHIVKMPLNLLLELVVLVGRIIFIGAIFVAVRAVERSEATALDSWAGVGENIVLLLGSEWPGLLAQTLVVIGAVLLANSLLAFLVTEQRTAQLLERMQNKATPGVVQKIIVLSLKNMIIIPVMLVSLCLLLRVA